MKIAHALGWYLPDSVGGTEVYVEGLCRRLRSAGHDVLIAAPDSHHAVPERYLHDDCGEPLVGSCERCGERGCYLRQHGLDFVSISSRPGH